MTQTITLKAVLTAVAMLFAASANADDAKRADSGKFNLVIKGMKSGTSTFKFDSSGSCDADVAIDIAGQSQKIKVSVKAKDGKVYNVAASAGPANKFSAALEGNKAKLSVNGDAATAHTIPAGALPFGNFSPFLLNYTLSAYDARKAGAQTFDLLLIEGLPNGQFVSFKGKLTDKGTAERKLAGKQVQVKSYSLMIQAGGAEIEMKLYADSDRHLLAWEVPTQGYTAAREGYEDVIKPVTSNK